MCWVLGAGTRRRREAEPEDGAEKSDGVDESEYSELWEYSEFWGASEFWGNLRLNSWRTKSCSFCLRCIMSSSVMLSVGALSVVSASLPLLLVSFTFTSAVIS